MIAGSIGTAGSRRAKVGRGRGAVERQARYSGASGRGFRSKYTSKILPFLCAGRGAHARAAARSRSGQAIKSRAAGGLDARGTQRIGQAWGDLRAGRTTCTQTAAHRHQI